MISSKTRTQKVQRAVQCISMLLPLTHPESHQDSNNRTGRKPKASLAFIAIFVHTPRCRKSPLVSYTWLNPLSLNHPDSPQDSHQTTSRASDT